MARGSICQKAPSQRRDALGSRSGSDFGDVCDVEYWSESAVVSVETPERAVAAAMGTIRIVSVCHPSKQRAGVSCCSAERRTCFGNDQVRQVLGDKGAERRSGMSSRCAPVAQTTMTEAKTSRFMVDG